VSLMVLSAFKHTSN